MRGIELLYRAETLDEELLSQPNSARAYQKKFEEKREFEGSIFNVVLGKEPSTDLTVNLAMAKIHDKIWEGAIAEKDRFAAADMSLITRK